VLIIDDKKGDIVSIKDSLNQAGFDCEDIEVETGEDGSAKIKYDFPRIYQNYLTHVI